MAQNKNTKTDRKRMVLAMEYVCRQINDEDVFMGWLMNGVPDGDVPYGCFDTEIISDDDTLIEDDNFRELMECFLRRMEGAAESGGLYCGDVVTSERKTCEYVRQGRMIHPTEHAEDNDPRLNLDGEDRRLSHCPYCGKKIHIAKKKPETN